MESVLLSRAVYSAMVDAYLEYMRVRWLEMRRQWMIGGVRASGTPEQVAELRGYLRDFQAQAAEVK